MDREEYLVRPFTDLDYEAVSRIGRKVTPEFPFSPEEERQWVARFMTSDRINERWIVEERSTSTVVAWGSMSHAPHAFEPRKFWSAVEVDPAHRGRGIGRTLAALIESEAGSHGAVCLWTNVRTDDPRSFDFAQRHGFRELRRVWMSTLDLTQERPEPGAERGKALERDGMRFTTLSEEGPAREETRRKLLELLNETSRDVPRVGKFAPMTYEQFVKEFESPSFLPEACFLAAVGDEYVAISSLERSLAEPDSLRVDFTGTRSAYRGRGVASELKRRALEYARARGVRSLRTVNDSLNRPMWAINAKQGFVRTFEWSAQERRFPPAPTTGESGEKG
ncbi:MAG: GNAT family N-acetyltransferase [Thermoplasmata archaeon]